MSVPQDTIAEIIMRQHDGGITPLERNARALDHAHDQMRKWNEKVNLLMVERGQLMKKND